MEQQQEVHKKSHPGPRQYVVIAAILSIVTAIEVGIFYLEVTLALIATLVLATSALKFALVVGYYMHLRFDDRRFLALFGTGLFIAVSIMIILLALFDKFTR